MNSHNPTVSAGTGSASIPADSRTHAWSNAHNPFPVNKTVLNPRTRARFSQNRPSPNPILPNEPISPPRNGFIFKETMELTTNKRLGSSFCSGAYPPTSVSPLPSTINPGPPQCMSSSPSRCAGRLLISTELLPATATHVFGPQQWKWIPESPTRSAGRIFTSVSGDPVSAGPMHTCGQSSLKCVSAGTKDLSPSRDCGCIVCWC
jgi:hypothetical protein